MSRKNQQEVVQMIDDNGNIIEETYPKGNDYNRDAIDIMHEEEEKKEISKLNRLMVNNLKSEIRTVIIALDRSVTLSELHEACEFFADTSVDIKLIKRAIRQLVKDERLIETEKNSYELPQKKRDFFSALQAIKDNPTRR